MPKVSVIIPTYNRNRRLKRAIQSVLDQTYQNFEIIVIDDASTVSPEDIVISFQDHRIKFIHHSSNKGGSAARNTGIKASKGEYIAFLDSDDEWLPEKLDFQINYFKGHEANIGAVYTGLTAISEESTVIGERIPHSSGDLRSSLFADNCIGPLSTLTVKRAYLYECGLFDESLPSCQDWDLCIRLSALCHFGVISDSLVRYYVNSDSITANPIAKAKGHKYILEKYLPYIKPNKQAYAKQSLTIGHYLYCSGKRKEALSFFFKALFSKPLYAPVYLYLFTAIFFGFAYNRLILIKRDFSTK